MVGLGFPLPSLATAYRDFRWEGTTQPKGVGVWTPTPLRG